jgi:phosphatidate cytidylyltransferase
MHPAAHDRMFGYQHAFDHPVTLWLTVGLAIALLVIGLLLIGLRRKGYVSAEIFAELRRRYLSWLILTPLLLVPILLGAAWVILGIGVLSLFCYREYARATGLFRDRSVSTVIVIRIVATTFSVFDHWYRLFSALTPLTVVLIAAVAILSDQPKGYIQRVAWVFSAS